MCSSSPIRRRNRLISSWNPPAWLRFRKYLLFQLVQYGIFILCHRPAVRLISFSTSVFSEIS